MSGSVGIAGDRIRSFIERVEHIEEELKALNEGKKEVFAEAKGEGFDVKVLKEILRLRKQDKDERDEQDSCSTSTCRPWRAARNPSAKPHELNLGRYGAFREPVGIGYQDPCCRS